MHLVIPAHISLFWMVCHSSRIFPPKELERESQNRLLLSPHRQTIPSLTSDPWPIAPVLAWYRWVVPKPYACSTPTLCVLHSHMSPWLVCCSCVCHYLWICLVSLRVLLLIFNPLWCGWVWVFILCISFLLWAESCLGMGPFFFNSSPVSFYFWFVGQLILLPRHCIISAIYRLTVLVGSLLGLSCIYFLYLVRVA